MPKAIGGAASESEHMVLYLALQQQAPPSRSDRDSLYSSQVTGSYGGKPVSWSLNEFCELVAKGGAAGELEARVVSVEHAGGVAMARLELLNWRGTRYTDFFVLVEREGGWRIDSKVFFAHSRA